MTAAMILQISSCHNATKLIKKSPLEGEQLQAQRSLWFSFPHSITSFILFRDEYFLAFNVIGQSWQNCESQETKDITT